MIQQKIHHKQLIFQLKDKQLLVNELLNLLQLLEFNKIWHIF